MTTSQDNPGTLFVVATPIGNLDDISLRARTVLAAADLIAAEDTRHTQRLLQRFGIRTPLLSCHEHNEAERTADIVARLQSGADVALVSDAGTPLLSDPGFRLVAAAAAAGLRVSPVPGCSAAMAALSVAGLPTDQVLFTGFLPASAGKRRARLEALRLQPATLVVYEAVHRVQAALADMVTVFGPERQAVAARELTKLHETVYRGTLAQLTAQLAAGPGADKGEYTLVIAGAAPTPTDGAELDRILGIMLGFLGVRQAADATVAILGVRRNDAYRRALEIRASAEGDD
ncbi:MAG: 16S rRNA (cytidine(1402)-2'-O)-methyltransferase [Gammaproteobacteria bacterium]|nr:16S rRNA (cytidine(1402)-2'-O)-methyltransferase [Gammaproteobacteria bacterium]